MERKNNLSSRMSDISANTISTINSFSSHSSISTLSSLKVKHSYISSVTLSTIKTTRVPIYNSTIVASLSVAAIQEIQNRAKTDHSAIGQSFSEFNTVFNKYNTTTDPTEKAAWLVIAQNRLNELQALNSVNSMNVFLSTITNVV